MKKLEKISAKIAANFGDPKKANQITAASMLRYLKMNEITFRKNGKEVNYSYETCQKMMNHAGEMIGKVNRVDEEFDDSDEEVNESNIKDYLVKKRDHALDLGLVGQYRNLEEEENKGEEKKNFTMNT